MNVKNVCLGVYLFSGVLFTLQVYAQQENGNEGYWINSVNHKDHSIVINDNRYIMPITLDTYIVNTKTGKERKVNRYALKEGQLVLFRKAIRDRQAYIEEITVYQP